MSVLHFVLALLSWNLKDLGRPVCNGSSSVSQHDTVPKMVQISNIFKYSNMDMVSKGVLIVIIIILSLLLLLLLWCVSSNLFVKDFISDWVCDDDFYHPIGFVGTAIHQRVRNGRLQGLWTLIEGRWSRDESKRKNQTRCSIVMFIVRDNVSLLETLGTLYCISKVKTRKLTTSNSVRFLKLVDSTKL